MTRRHLLALSAALAIALTSAAHAAGEAGVCLVEADATDAGPLRDAVTAAAAEIDAAVAVVQVAVRRDGDLAPLIDRLVASACHLIAVTSEGGVRAIVVLSAADGPMPQTRAVTRILGALGAEDVVVFVHRLEQNSDPELLQLVEIEMRALLSAGGLPGDATPFEQCTPECRGEPFRPGH